MTPLAAPCTDRLSHCRCSLGVHSPDVAHHCRDWDHVKGGECGGMWLSHPADPTLVLIVRFPVAAAELHGIAQPTEPVEADRLTPAQRFARNMEQRLLDKMRSPDA